MATRQDFCNEMNRMYENHGMYVGTGNGERTLDVAGKFFEMEKNYGRRDKSGNPLWYTDTARDYEYLAKCYRKGWNMENSQAADCSGAEVSALRKLGILKSTADYNCKMFLKVCKERGKLVPIKNLQPGDLVFNKEVDPTHMATYVGDGVVEFKGRDDGCVKRKVSAGGWAIGGRLPDDWFEGGIPVLTRNLYYRADDLMKGEDVKMAQERLNLKGCEAGVEDGIFGKRTRDAVIQFQELNNPPLEVDAVIGQQTWTLLWKD